MSDKDMIMIIVRVDCGIASISSFRIDVPLFSKNVQFGVETTRIESDDKVELREILRLLCLSSGQYLGSGKVLKVFIICNNVNRID